MDEISDTLLKQRLRNRLMECLDAFSDEGSVGVIGADGIIEMWYDYMDNDRLGFYGEPVFSAEEVNAIKRFHNLLEATYMKIPGTWDGGDLAACKEWLHLVTAAREEYEIFIKRGLSDEEREIT